MSKYGKCSRCGTELEPVWFTENEYTKNMVKTGRTRLAVSHLTCKKCLNNECVDDSFDRPWRNN